MPVTPQISAIICTHNRDRYLAKAIDSLLNQTCEHYEILIIDNASTDSTAQVVEPYLSHPRVRY
jgi:glycosyltransferase involved in cell wall biosynthesis